MHEALTPCIFKLQRLRRFYYAPLNRAVIILNGTKAISAKVSFTNQSAKANVTQRGAIAPTFMNGTASHAQEIAASASAPNIATVAENAIVKNSAVSSADPTSVEIRGARHQVPLRKRLKIPTSVNCAIKKAVPDPIATRSGTAGPYSNMIWLPMSEQMMPMMKPAKTTRRAAETP